MLHKIDSYGALGQQGRLGRLGCLCWHVGWIDKVFVNKHVIAVPKVSAFFGIV